MIPPETNTVTTDQIQSHFNANDRFGVVGFVERIGFGKFMTRLEHEHYNPQDIELNNRFQMFIIQHQDMTFFIVSIPLEDRHLAEKIAEECDLRFADGVPTFIGEGRAGRFPIQHKNLWSCENLPNSDVYKGKAAELAAAERLWLQEFWANKENELGG